MEKKRCRVYIKEETSTVARRKARTMIKEVQITNYEPIDYIINTHFGDIPYRIYCAKQISELMEGNDRNFYINYGDMHSERVRETAKCCAIFETKEVIDD